MAESNLAQADADALLALPKRRADAKERSYPDLGGEITVPLVFMDRQELFCLDIRRGRTDLAKGSYQNRARQLVILARLDFGGRPHRNPDHTRVASPHLHLYREGYADKWAFPVPVGLFANVADAWRTLEDFMQFCNVVEPPIIRRGLFT